MRMTAYDHPEPRRYRIQVEFPCIVKHIQQGSIDFDNLGFWEFSSPRPSVHVPPHRDDRRMGSQRIEDLRSPHITGVNDQLNV